MVKNHLVVLLTTALIAGLLVTPPATFAQSSNSDDAAQVRADVQKFSANPDNKVDVTFRDKTKLKGSIMSVDRDNFVLSESKTRANHTVRYAEVLQVKKASNGSRKPWLILGGVAAGAIVTWAIVKPAVCDGGAQSRGPC